MPLLGFRPTKARLVMENARDSVLVMKVALEDDDPVELVTGGTLGALGGVLRIKERKGNGAANGDGVIGALVYVAEPPRNGDPATGKYQVTVGMAADKFATLLAVANAGRLPTRFIVDAGGPVTGAEGKALAYRVRAGRRSKVWDNHAFRTLPLTSFVMILPIDVPASPLPEAPTAEAPAPAEALATNAQVAELMDDMLVFQSDTRHTMFGLVLVMGIVALAALALAIGVFFR